MDGECEVGEKETILFRVDIFMQQAMRIDILPHAPNHLADMFNVNPILRLFVAQLLQIKYVFRLVAVDLLEWLKA